MAYGVVAVSAGDFCSLGRGASPVSGGFTSLKSFGTENSASFNGSCLSEVSVVVTSFPPSETTVLMGTPGKSRYSGMPILLGFQASEMGACICFRMEAASGYLVATQKVALNFGVS